MEARRKKKDKKIQSKKDKKLIKLINNSDSENEESEHQLSFYLNDRVKLMKEVLKIIKPKKIKSMAPDCMKSLDNEEINSMLLEELLGISNKRLKYIFNGQTIEGDSSSTDPEEEQLPIDVISLDDISDDDFIIDLDSDADSQKKQHKKHGKPKVKEEHKRKRIKKEKHDKIDKNKSTKKSKETEKGKSDEQNLMSVLELLELQARARAIKSQLVLEHSKKQQEKKHAKIKLEESDNEDAIIIDSPKNIEIVITSSDSENDSNSEHYINKANDMLKGIMHTGSETTTPNSVLTGPEKEVNQGSNSNKDKNIEDFQSEEINKTDKDSIVNKSCEEIENPITSIEQDKSTHPSDDEQSPIDRNKTLDKSETQLEAAKNCLDKSLPNSEYSQQKRTNIMEEGIPSTSKQVFTINSGSESDRAKEKCFKKNKKPKKLKTRRSIRTSSDGEIKTVKNQEISKNTNNVNEKEDEAIEVSTEKEIIENQQPKESDNAAVQSENKSSSTDEGDGIIINVDLSEIDCF